MELRNEECEGRLLGEPHADIVRRSEIGDDDLGLESSQQRESGESNSSDSSSSSSEDSGTSHKAIRMKNGSDLGGVVEGPWWSR